MLRFTTNHLIHHSFCRSHRYITTGFNKLPVGYTAPDPDAPQIETKIASIALVGAPNVGKSSLSNAMIEARISAVSRKMNTTRGRTIGAYTHENRQLIFWDTPGLVERQFIKSLGPERKQLTTEAWGAAADADLLLMVVDTSRNVSHWKTCAHIANQLADIRLANPGMVLVLNKCDKVTPRSRILEATDYFRNEITSFSNSFADRVFMVSAYNGRGVHDLRDALLQLTVPGDFELDADVKHGDEDLDLIRQHVWEKLLHRCHDEIPYRCQFENDEMKDLKDGALYVSEVIRVERPSVVPIVIGPKGGVIEWIRNMAEEGASEALGRRVVLKLRVASR